jgi:hypothetical protein
VGDRGSYYESDCQTVRSNEHRGNGTDRCLLRPDCADGDGDENYTKAYKAAYQDCLGHVLDEAKGRLGWE